MTSFRRLVVVVAVAACIACATTEDLFGPAAGFAELDGFVRDPSGNPVSGVQVLLSGCGPPALGGETGKAFTGSDGGYSMLAELPPVSVVGPLDRDSIVTTCVMIAARDTSTTRTLDVWFWADPTKVQPISIDFAIR